MANIGIIQGRTISPTDIEHIRGLMTAHPHWSRYRLSQVLVQEWNWRTANGQLKDMATRNLLVQMNERGVITLPPRRRPATQRRAHGFLPVSPDGRVVYTLRNTPARFAENNTALPSITEPLAELTPLYVDVMNVGHPDHVIFSQYLTRFHYLGYRGCVGEKMFYLVRDRCGRDLACVLFSAAAWKTQPRDTFIGWDHATRSGHLAFVTNNTRFLILPGVHVPHLASHLLGILLRRLSSDWQEKYNHPVYLVETFVERDRFKGTCYRAANWICVGQTKGRSRNDRYSTLKVPIKDIYLYPLITNFREKLCHANP